MLQRQTGNVEGRLEGRWLEVQNLLWMPCHQSSDGIAIEFAFSGRRSEWIFLDCQVMMLTARNCINLSTCFDNSKFMASSSSG